MGDVADQEPLLKWCLTWHELSGMLTWKVMWHQWYDRWWHGVWIGSGDVVGRHDESWFGRWVWIHWVSRWTGSPRLISGPVWVHWVLTSTESSQFTRSIRSSLLGFDSFERIGFDSPCRLDANFTIFDSDLPVFSKDWTGLGGLGVLASAWWCHPCVHPPIF